MPIVANMPPPLRLLVLAAAATLIATPLGSPGLAGADPIPSVARCSIFPPGNPWHQRVDDLPVARNSATLIRSVGLDAPIHAGFGSGRWNGTPIGIPVNVASPRTKRVRVRFDRAYAPRADRQPYPIPGGARIEGGSDHHLIVVDRSTCRDYELYGADRLADGRWQAVTGVVFNLRSNRLRPPGWASADAAGLAILPSLARYAEVARGSIDHALRFDAPRTRAAFVYPARHYAQDNENRSLPPMGLRVRLKAGVKISRLPRQARIVAQALKRYGMILADVGPAWTMGGTPDPRWNNDDLHALDRLLSGRDLEVVDTSSLPHPAP
jgi:hypothetical protein